MFRYYAKPDLQERLALLAGSQRKYIVWTHARLPASAGSTEWLRRVLNRRSSTPMALVVALIRVAEEDPHLERDEAWLRRRKYFEEV